ncbi:MAG: succinylglutamate desuccinylase/aspartoacylase family protein, partial [Armatimonadota bacterium]
MAAQVAVEYVSAQLSDGSTLATPYWRVSSGREGPFLLIVAAQHGNEVQGSEVIRRFLPLCAETLRAGEAWLVPFMSRPALHDRRNTAGLGAEEKGTPFHQAHNMNGQWPGDPAGSDIARIVHALDRAIVRHCSHVIDLHCWNKFWATATLATDDGGESRRMGEAAGSRFVWWREVPDLSAERTQIRTVVMARGGAGMAMELAGQYLIDEREVLTGLRAVS